MKWLASLPLVGRFFENADERVLRLRAELAEIDGWIPHLERYIDAKRARRREILLKLVEVEAPDAVARQMEGQ